MASSGEAFASGVAWVFSGDLFERVAYGDPLGEAEKKRYVGDILQGAQRLSVFFFWERAGVLLEVFFGFQRTEVEQN